MDMLCFNSTKRRATNNASDLCQNNTSCYQEIAHKQICKQTKQVYIQVPESHNGKTGIWDFLAANQRSSCRFNSGISMAILFKLAILFILLLVPMPSFAFNSDRTTPPQHDSPAHPARVNCPRHFGHRVQSCVAPFTSLLDLYTANAKYLTQTVTIAKQVCIEYQMVLLCLHSALSECPTLKNLKRVQDTLGSQWVTGINELCSIQSKSTSEPSGAEKQELKNYAANTNSPMNTHQIAHEILRASMKTRAELEKEILTGHNEDSPSAAPLLPERREMFPSHQELDYFQRLSQKSPVSTNGNAKLELNIVNVIQNYNYPTLQRQHVTVRLVSAEYNSAVSSTTSLALLALGCMVCVWHFLL